MKKLLGTILALSLLLVVLVPMAGAVTEGDITGGLTEFGTESKLPSVELHKAIGRIVNVVIGFLGLIAAVIIIAGGFMWMTSGGNDEKIGKARKLMIQGVIGLVIILLAYSISKFVIAALVKVGA